MGSLLRRHRRLALVLGLVAVVVGLRPVAADADVIAPPAPPVTVPVTIAVPGLPGGDPGDLIGVEPSEEQWDGYSDRTREFVCAAPPLVGWSPRMAAHCADYPTISPVEGGDPAGPTVSEVPGGPDLTDYQTVATEMGWEWVGGAISTSGGHKHLLGTEAWEDTSWTHAETGVHRWVSQFAAVFIPDHDGPTTGGCGIAGMDDHLIFWQAVCASGSNANVGPKWDGSDFGGAGPAATLNVSRPHLVYVSVIGTFIPDSFWGGNTSFSTCIAIDADGCAGGGTTGLGGQHDELKAMLQEGLYWGFSGMPDGHLYGLIHTKPGTTVDLSALWGTLVTPPEVEEPHTVEVPFTMPTVTTPTIPEVSVPPVPETVTEPAPTAAPAPEYDPETDPAPSETTDVALGDRLTDALRGVGDYIVGGILWLGQVVWDVAAWMADVLWRLLQMLIATLWAMLAALMAWLGAWLGLILQWLIALVQMLSAWLAALFGALSGIASILTLGFDRLVAWLAALLAALNALLVRMPSWDPAPDPEAPEEPVPTCGFFCAVVTLVVPPDGCLTACTEAPDPPEVPDPPTDPMAPVPVPPGGSGTRGCGPSIVLPTPWDRTVNLPTPAASGCPGNGPGGARTSADDSAGDLFGWREPFRAFVAFALAVAVGFRFLRALPWNRTGEDLGVSE